MSWLPLSKLFRMRREVARHAGRAFLHPRLAPGPAGGAYLPVLLEELQGVHHAQHLVDVPSQREIVDDLVAHDALLVDEERSAEGPAAGRLHVVGPGYQVPHVRDD